MSVDGGRDGVAEGYLGAEFPILQSQLVLLDDVVIRVLILSDVGEVEIGQLQHCFHVLGGGIAAHGHTTRSHRESGVGNLTGQCLAQLGEREVAQTTAIDHAVERLDIGIVFLAVHGVSGTAYAAHDDLVFLVVGLFQQHGHAIAEGEDVIAELLALLLFRDFSRFREFGHQGLVLHVVHVGLDFLRTGFAQGAKQLCLRGVYVTFLLVVEVDDNQVGVVLAYQAGKHLVDGF